MTKEEIKKFIDKSKKELDSSCDDYIKSIHDDLAIFKKKTLDRI